MIISLKDSLFEKKQDEAERALRRDNLHLNEESFDAYMAAQTEAQPHVFEAKYRYRTQCLPLKTNFVPDPSAPCILDVPELAVLLDKRRKKSTMRAELALFLSAPSTRASDQLTNYLKSMGVWFGSSWEPGAINLIIEVEHDYIVKLFEKAGMPGYITLLAKYACRVNLGNEPYVGGPHSHTSLVFKIGASRAAQR